MQVCEYLEKCCYGQDSFQEKVVWVCQTMGKDKGVAKFSIVISMMLPYPDGSLIKKVMYRSKKSNPETLHVMYRMTAGAHRACTWGGKKSDGTPRFKRKKYETTSVQETKSSGGSGLTKSNKQYYCKGCQGKVYIERDDAGNAYCVDCGKKMFG
ncbi:hypothetical protein ES708_20504 [subsurface metagenome]